MISFSCFLGDNTGLITSDKIIIFVPLHDFYLKLPTPSPQKLEDEQQRRGGGTGNLIRPPFCLFPIKKWRPPHLCWALPEGQPNN